MNPSLKGIITVQSAFALLVFLLIVPSFYYGYLYYQDAYKINEKLLLSILTLYVIANLGYALYFLKNNVLEDRNQSFSIFLVFNLLFLIPVFPISAFTYLYNPGRIFKSIKNSSTSGIIKLSIKKIIYSIFLLIIIMPFWAVVYLGASAYLRNEYLLNRDSINVAGTGSMYPTFPKGTSKSEKDLSAEVVASPGMTRYPAGISLFGKTFFNYSLQHGDIVAFSNPKVMEIIKDDELSGNGFIKRIIAMPGDSLEIRDGAVILNGKTLIEPYIARARSTFGGDTLEDCKILRVPQHKLFVMGDNRKSSHDSRFKLGLIDIADVDHVIPANKQIGILDKNYRDTSHDNDPSAKIKLNKDKYIEMLNDKRAEFGLKPLKSSLELDKAAKERGDIMFKTQNLNPNTSDGPDSMKSILDAKNLSTILIGEAAVKGYFDEQELIDNQFEFSTTKKFLTNKDFKEIGIAEVEGQIAGCPTQVIVSHLSGYIPPEYTKEQIDGVIKSVNNLKETKASWIKAKNDPAFYNENKKEFDRIFEILDIQLNSYEAIKTSMLKTQWLTKEQLKFINEDSKVLGEERDKLMDKINDKINEMTKNPH